MRRLVQRAGVCACASLFLLAVAPAAAVSQRHVSFAVSGTGKAFWKLDAKTDTGRLSLRYRWHGTIGFDISPAQLRDATHRGVALLASDRTCLTVGSSMQ